MPKELLCRLRAIPAEKWSIYGKRNDSSAVEGISVLLEAAMKVSIERKSESKVSKDQFGTTTLSSIQFVMEVRSGKDVVFDSSGSDIEALHTEIKQKIEEFERLPEEKKRNLLELKKAEATKRLFSVKSGSFIP